jgi:beta-N-acetylglucosaminidase
MKHDENEFSTKLQKATIIITFAVTIIGLLTLLINPNKKPSIIDSRTKPVSTPVVIKVQSDENTTTNNDFKVMSLYQYNLFSYENPETLADNFIITKDSLANVDEINDFLKDTELNGLGDILSQAQNLYGVNDLFLMSIAILESGWGSSDIAHQYNNIMGYGVLDTGNLEYTYENYEHCILSVASSIRKHFIDAYYLNDDCTINDIGKIYCTNSEWSYRISEILIEFNNKYYNKGGNDNE